MSLPSHTEASGWRTDAAANEQSTPPALRAELGSATRSANAEQRAERCTNAGTNAAHESAVCGANSASDAAGQRTDQRTNATDTRADERTDRGSNAADERSDARAHSAHERAVCSAEQRSLQRSDCGAEHGGANSGTNAADARTDQRADAADKFADKRPDAGSYATNACTNGGTDAADIFADERADACTHAAHICANAGANKQPNVPHRHRRELASWHLLRTARRGAGALHGDRRGIVRHLPLCRSPRPSRGGSNGHRHGALGEHAGDRDALDCGVRRE